MNEDALAAAAEQLPTQYAERIGEQGVEGLNAFAVGGEWGLVIQELLAGLQAVGATITPTEREHLGELITSLDPDEVEAITYGPPLTERLQQIPVREESAEN